MDERRERIEQLRLRKAQLESEAHHESAAESEPRLRFRNYRPHDQDLKGHQLPPAPLLSDQVVRESESIVKGALSEPELVNIVPKKANWDLKRDLEARMQELEHRTQLAIVELIKERLVQQGDLAGSDSSGEDSGDAEDSDESDSRSDARSVSSDA